jgi:hypothetical protein
MQKGDASDLYDSERTMCCAFLPNGVNKEASFGYLDDPAIGLLQLKTAIDTSVGLKEHGIIGVAILGVCEDSQKHRTVLMVDSVEGNNEYLKVVGNDWKQLMYDGIIGVAKDIGVRTILFNEAVGNSTPERFVEFLRELKLEWHECELALISKPNKDRYLEAFGGWEKPKGKVTGYLVEW